MLYPPSLFLNSGDEVLPDTPFSGENLCYRCNSKGKQLDGKQCNHCDGSGLIYTVVKNDG